MPDAPKQCGGATALKPTDCIGGIASTGGINDDATPPPQKKASRQRGSRSCGEQRFVENASRLTLASGEPVEKVLHRNAVATRFWEPAIHKGGVPEPRVV